MSDDKKTPPKPGDKPTAPPAATAKSPPTAETKTPPPAGNTPAAPAEAKPATPPNTATPAPAAAAASTPTPAAPAQASASPEAKAKPPPFTATQISEQIAALQIQKEQLTGTLTQLKHHHQKIQTALKENDVLRVKITSTLGESYSFFLEEWKRKSDFFPEIRLQTILKAVEVLTPKKK